MPASLQLFRASSGLAFALLVALGSGCQSAPSQQGGDNSGGSASGGRGGSGGTGGRGGSGGSTGGSSTGGVGGSGASTGGAGGGSTSTGGSTGTGGSGSGGTGTGGSAGTTGSDAGDSGPGPDAELPSCAGPNLQAGNRCAVPAQVSKGMGTDPLIDDMEPAPGESPACHKIRTADGRSGIWNFGKDDKSPGGQVNFMLEAPGAGAKAGSTRALRFNGQGLNGYGGYLATPLAACYDASAYKGLSFWVKGDPAKAP